MLDSLFMFGMGIALIALVALVNPVLLGWRSRRDAVVALAIAACLLTAGWAARFL
ncbi:MAG TPA: hypothetical protein VM791_13245 [Vicinamibacterales bacterium]|jgi:hypothetical protein|nr:hypothetical protein [Vicinamibacterales bacterium]